MSIETRAPRRAPWTQLQPDTWRADLLRILLRLFAVLGSLTYLPSVGLALKFGMLGIVALDTVALGAIGALLFVPRLPPKVRAAGASLVMYLLGAGLMVGVGSISQIYLFAFSLLATLLLGARWGLVTVGLNAVTMLGIGYLGIASPEMVLPRWTTNFAGWSVITGNFVFVNMLLVLALGAVIGALEAALARAVEDKALLRSAGQTARIGGWRVNLGAPTVQWSDEVCELHEVPTGTAPTLEEAVAFYLPEYRGPLGEAVERCTRDGSPFDVVAEIVTAKGTRLWVRAIGNAGKDASGAITHVHGSVQDITPAKLAEAKHARLEVQLRQAQKMDAVGQLAGGVAHDFNNMLGVILIHANLTLESLDADDPRRDDVQQIVDGAKRSAALTRQLLAFARKQTIAPETIDLNEAIGSLLKMLARLIGEHIELRFKPAADLSPVLMDAAQVDQILANLAVNARDAIAGTGTLSIETRNVSFDQQHCELHAGHLPGRFVEVSVSDDGAGMDKATQARLFEPFFTTKQVGMGTGLGLATVYGIVKQNRGFITVYSEVGHGSTFRVYLPRSDGPLAAERGPAKAPVLRRGTETVLLVEDEEALLQVVKRLLVSLGYTVIAAKSPREALALAGGQQTIQLLITDVIMPQMTGREVWQSVSRARPEAKCLFMSGYSADVISRHGVLDERVNFIQKPFTLEALAEGVRTALERG